MAKTKAEMIDDIQRMRRSLRASATQIKKREDLPQFGAESFLKFESRLRKTLGKRKLSSLREDEIRTIYRDVSYLKYNVKSTNLRGAERAAKDWVPVRDRISVLSKDRQKAVYELYDRYVNRFELLERFKYEIYETIVDYVYAAYDVDLAIKELIEVLDKTLEGNGGKITDAEFNIRFPAALKEVRDRLT